MSHSQPHAINNNWEADKMLDIYIYDYLRKRNLQATLKAFQEEADVSTDSVAIDAPGGFLLEWWSVFWDIFIARTNEKHSDVAASYLETQMIKNRELQQQQQYSHQKPQNQQQTHYILLKRHAQQQQQHQQQQQRDLSLNTGLNPVGFLDTLRRQPSGTASVLTSKINGNTLRDPLRRDNMDIRSRLDEHKAQSLDPKQISKSKLDITSIEAQRQTLNRISGGSVSHVHNQNPQLPLNGQNKGSLVTDDSSAGDSQHGSLLRTHGSSHGGNNLTLNGWPLTGLDQLKAGLQHKQHPVPPYQLYMQQQHLYQAQQSMIVPPVAGLDSMRMRMFLNCKNAGIPRDGQPRYVGDMMTNVGSQMQAADDSLLNKVYRQHQLSVQQSQNFDHNSNPRQKVMGSGATDSYMSNNSQRINQASKMETGKKRKMASGPSNSSGTLNTNAPSLSSIPSPPSNHTADAISMPSFSKNGLGSKSSAIVTSDDNQTLPSTVQSFTHADRSLMNRPLEDNVESFLSADMIDSAGTSSINDGFTFVEHQAIPVSTKVECCAFSSDGKLLATGGQDKKVVLWCTESYTMKSMLDEHTLMITDIRFCPTNLKIATSSADQTIKVWDVDNPTRSLRTFMGHSVAVTSLDFHPCKDDLVYSADANGEIRCWSITNGNCKTVFQCDVTCIRFEPLDGRFFVGASDNIVSIFDVETQTTRLKLQGHKKQVTCLCWDYSGEYLASVSEDVARVWSFAPGGNGECIHEFSSTRNDFRSCCFHHAFSFLLVIGCNQMLELWNMVENKMMTIPAHVDGIYALATSNVSGLVASGSSDGYVKLWK